ncbi:uncharacterized protein B0H18DRAFT_880188, partial [Fomitopsis serialis]|uniref:uncharacterized protein n=1 Tax=Fomitopsis serialis TaxID=139415 RepID=UPI00200791D9
ILSGDFYQLPPVPDHIDGVPQPATFCFDAHSWPDCVGQAIALNKVFRQRDQDFVDMLNEMRLGRLSQSTMMAFRRLSRRVVYHDDIEPTDLFPTRRQVYGANHTRLEQLQGTPMPFPAADQPGIDNEGFLVTVERMDKLLEQQVIAPKHINLKVVISLPVIICVIEFSSTDRRASDAHHGEFCPSELFMQIKSYVAEHSPRSARQWIRRQGCRVHDSPRRAATRHPTRGGQSSRA